jgi:GntR family transcriptional regulator, rspAB operon transcriptional repressor
MYQRVTETLRSEIISGRLKPNSRLKVPELAIALGVSPSPVREAIQKLQSEGLIVLKPNHGAVVRTIDAQEFTHLMRLRAAIEGMQAGLCAELRSAALLEKLEVQVERFDQAVKTGNQDARLKSNAVIHKLINGIDGSAIAQETLGRIEAITASVRRQWPLRPDRLERAQEEHYALISAIRRQDSQAANAVARDHVLATLQDVLTLMEQSPAS